jgi:hypothetical protein
MDWCGLAVGWVDIGTSTGVQSGFVYFHEKTQKTAKKSFLVKRPFEERAFFSV